MQYVPIVISVISLLFTLYTYASKENKNSATELTTVIVKLETIGNGISDIKAEIASMKTDQKEDHDKLIKLGADLNTVWKRIDELNAKTKTGGIE